MTTNVNGYRPPMGRPISSPRDGGPPPLLCAKAPPEPPKVANTRPVRMDGENPHAYAARVLVWKMKTDPEYSAKVRKNRSRSRLKTINKTSNKADRIAIARNKTETRGVWMTARQYAKTRPYETSTNCYLRASKMGWVTEKVSGRILFLVPHDHVSSAAEAAPNQAIEVPVATQPSIWRRVASWLWG